MSAYDDWLDNYGNPGIPNEWPDEVVCSGCGIGGACICGQPDEVIDR